MSSLKSILITGATDGIGLAAAKLLAGEGHHLVLHGRNPDKLQAATEDVGSVSGAGEVESIRADLSDLGQVADMAASLADRATNLDVVINNAGIFNAPQTLTTDGLDVRFAVNTVAPYLLAQRLLPQLPADGRIVNLSSAAQAPVDIDALQGNITIEDDFQAYAQSKLALTMWSREMGLACRESGPLVVSLNPGSLIGTKMVKEGFGIEGSDISIGATIIFRSALDDVFANARGEYFDNDAGDFGTPHADALDDGKCRAVTEAIEAVVQRVLGG